MNWNILGWQVFSGVLVLVTLVFMWMSWNAHCESCEAVDSQLKAERRLATIRQVLQLGEDISFNLLPAAINRLVISNRYLEEKYSNLKIKYRESSDKASFRLNKSWIAAVQAIRLWQNEHDCDRNKIPDLVELVEWLKKAKCSDYDNKEEGIKK